MKKFLLLIPMLALVQVSCTEKEEKAQPAPAGALTGVVKVDPALVGELSEGDVLYVIVRRSGEEQGAPLAVKRIDSPEFPYAFSVGPGDMMIPGTEFTGPFSVTAKLSKTGDALTHPGDLLGQAMQPSVPAGAEDVEVVLAEKAE